jgi:PIN domain nuclease of toxin-antitoxin system
MWGEKGADDVGVHLPGAVISSVNVAEILAKLISRGVPYGEAKEALEALNLSMVSFDVEEAWASGMFVGKEISLGDRAFLATAATHGGVGVTADRELRKVAARSRTVELIVIR